MYDYILIRELELWINELNNLIKKKNNNEFTYKANIRIDTLKKVIEIIRGY